MFNGLFNGLFSGLIGVLGVVLGALIADLLRKRQELKRLLIDLFSEVITLYMKVVAEKDLVSTEQWIATIERAKLVCDGEICEVLEKLKLAVVSENRDAKTCRDLFTRFCKLARTAVNHPHSPKK